MSLNLLKITNNIIKKNNFISEYTLDQLLNNIIYLGYGKESTNEKNAFFYSGIRGSIVLIDIIKTLYCLKNIIAAFNHVLNSQGSIWFVLPENFNKRILLNLFIPKRYKKKVYFWLDKWLAGLLTNYRNVLYSSRMQKKKRHFPQLVLYLRSERSELASKDAGYAGVGNVYILDTNNNANYVGYFLPGNEKSNKSILFYLNIFHNLIWVQHYYERILFIKKLLFNLKCRIFNFSYGTTQWNNDRHSFLRQLRRKYLIQDKQKQNFWRNKTKQQFQKPSFKTYVKSKTSSVQYHNKNKTQSGRNYTVTNINTIRK